MTYGLTRAGLDSWTVEGIFAAADELDYRRDTFVDLVNGAASSPDRIDPTWSGQSADACRERVSEEVEAARRYSSELEDVAASLRAVGRRLESAREHARGVAAEIEFNPCGLTVSDDWTVNISPMALVPTPDTDPERVREEINLGQERMNGAVRFVHDEDVACAELLEKAVDAAAQAGRRLDRAAAFRRVTGRSPENELEWQTASLLDPTSDKSANDGNDAKVVLGHITPQPGNGVVTMDLFIPSYSVFNTGFFHFDYDLGDFRGPDLSPETGDARVELAVDFETGLVVARQNPSVSEAGTVDVGTPLVKVQQLTDGGVRLGFEAANPLAPITGEPVHKVTGDLAVIPDNGRMLLGGVRSNYPEFEAYHHQPDGSVTQLITDPAASPLGLDQLGPIVALPFDHDVGDSRLLDQFEKPSAVRFAGDSTRPGAVVLGEESDDVVISPIAPRN